VGVNDAQCLVCGRRRPGLFGFAALLRRTGDDMGFLGLVLGVCGALFVASLAASPSVGGGGLLGLLAPDGFTLARFGATGGIAVYDYGRWWTIFSCAWLHGGLLHIAFNMMAAKDLIPAVAHLYGPARTIVIYVVAGASGALLTSSLWHYMPEGVPYLLRGSPLSIGASGAIFGLMGALAYYSRRGGSRALGEYVWRWAITGLIMGVAMPGIDNWGHVGGFAGGYLVSRWLDPLLPERGDHVIAAVVCLGVSAASIVASLLVDLPAGLR
jgi:rhomboid protease GluP